MGLEGEGRRKLVLPTGPCPSDPQTRLEVIGCLHPTGRGSEWQLPGAPAPLALCPPQSKGLCSGVWGFSRSPL